MADMVPVTINTALIPQIWVSKIQKEGEKENWVSKLTAKDGSNVIHQNTKLIDEKGTKITFGLAMELTGAGVTGNTVLKGQEENFTVYDFSVSIDQVRHAVASTEWDNKKPAYEQWPLIKDALKTWYGNWHEKTFVSKMTATPTSGEFISAAAAGTEVAITAADKLTCALISKAKRKAMMHSPKVIPVKVDGVDTYIMLVGTWAARDLKTDTTWIEAQRQANVRDAMKNPLFSGVIGFWDGVAVFEWERIANTATGAASANVVHNLLLGKQACCHAIGRNMWPIKQDDDYGNVLGQGVAFWGGMEKTKYNSKDYGCLQVLTGGAVE
jgi:N4-gp56 family major capsid protein